MADPQLIGQWTGVAVFRSLHSEIQMYFEQDNNAVIGSYEAAGVESKLSKGEISGSIDASGKVSFTVVGLDSVEFFGEITGQNHDYQMLSGVVNGGDSPRGTLTLFPDKLPDLDIARY